MWTCKHCNKNFDNLTASEKANHSRWCDQNPKKEFYKTNSANAIDAMKRAKIESGYMNQFSKAEKLGLKKPESVLKNTTHVGIPHTEETKQKLSKLRKEYLRNNPDKHPWRRNEKFKSIPCELFKQKLRDNDISFVEEYQPLLPDRFYSVDIAFPDKKIGVEINGNQHYNNDKTLKPYYQEKHDVLLDSGWKLFEYHYSIAYDELTLNNIIEKLKTDFNLEQINYDFYINKKDKIINKCLLCGKEIYKGSKHCRLCSASLINNKKNKFEISKEDLEKLIETKSYIQIGKMYGISESFVVKTAKKLGIVLPIRGRGYWSKKYSLDKENYGYKLLT